MGTPTTPPAPPPDHDRPVMGDHPDLELDDPARPAPAPAIEARSRLLLPGIAVLAIIVVVILFIIF